MDYTLVYLTHVTAVSLSISGFILRFIGVQMEAGWARSRLARIMPHIIDTLLLGSALTLVALMHMNPLQHPWLLAKIFALLVYIGLGMCALKPHRPVGVRVVSGVLALIVLSYIASVAITKNVGGWFSLIT